MASYKFVDSDKLDADLASVADRIRSKGGTTSVLVFPDGFKTAVDAISTGVTVQAKSGTFTTNSSSKATVDCGFRPDFVSVYTATYNGDEEGFSFPFSTQQNTSAPYLALGYHQNGVYEAKAERSSTGFTVTMADLGWDMNSGSATNKRFTYTAVKYTE